MSVYEKLYYKNKEPPYEESEKRAIFWADGPWSWGYGIDLSNMKVGEEKPTAHILRTHVRWNMSSGVIPPNFSAELYPAWGGVAKIPCGTARYIDWAQGDFPNDAIVWGKLKKCETWDDYKAKCCFGSHSGSQYGKESCNMFWGDDPLNLSTCDNVIKKWCDNHPNDTKCRCFKPQTPEYIKTSLEKSGLSALEWQFDKDCVGNINVYKPDYARRDINVTLNNCEQIINVSNNKSSLITNNEFTQYCGSAMTNYQKEVLNQLNELIKANNINVFNDFTKEEIVVYNNCVKQINENADSSCVEANIKPIITKVKQRKEIIRQNITKLTKLPTVYGIQDSDLPSMGEYSMMAFNDCRTLNIPNGDFQCMTDFENYFRSVQQKKIEAQQLLEQQKIEQQRLEQQRLEQEELLKQQQIASSVYTGDGDLGSYTQTKKSTTEVPDYQPDPISTGQPVTPTQIINALEGKDTSQQPSTGSSYQQPSYQQPSYQQPPYQQPSYQQPSIESERDYTTYIVIGVLLILLIVIFVLVIGVVAYGSIGGAYEKVKSKLKK